MNATEIVSGLDEIGAELRRASVPERSSAAHVYVAINRYAFADVIEALRLRALHDSDECSIAGLNEAAVAWQDVAHGLDQLSAVESAARRHEEFGE
jgi:hypothetical protein